MLMATKLGRVERYNKELSTIKPYNPSITRSRDKSNMLYLCYFYTNGLPLWPGGDLA